MIINPLIVQKMLTKLNTKAQLQGTQQVNQTVGAAPTNIAVDQGIQPPPIKMDQFQTANPSPFQPINEAFTGRAGRTVPIPPPSNELGGKEGVFRPKDANAITNMFNELGPRQESIGAYGEQFTNKY